MNLIKGLVTDRIVWGQAEEGWLAVHNQYVNGPAFGSLVGNVRAIGRFLQDQLQERSVLLDPAAKALIYAQQKDDHGRSLGMTLGWHISQQDGARYYYKEGGGGGFHCEMRLYPEKRDVRTFLTYN